MARQISGTMVQEMVTELHWEEDPMLSGLVAETSLGTYWVFDTAKHGYGGIAASFRPAQGRARAPKRPAAPRQVRNHRNGQGAVRAALSRTKHHVVLTSVWPSQHQRWC